MNKEDDDTLEDVNSLMKMIGGKKKDAPPRPTVAEKASPAAGVPASDAGDFSTLMKKLGMANKPEPAPCTWTCATGRPERARPSITPPDPLDSLFSDSDDQFEADTCGTPPEYPGYQWQGHARDPREDAGTGWSCARGSRACSGLRRNPLPLLRGLSRVPLPPVAEEEIVEIIDEDPKAALRKGKPVKAAKKVVLRTRSRRALRSLLMVTRRLSASTRSLTSPVSSFPRVPRSR